MERREKRVLAPREGEVEIMLQHLWTFYMMTMKMELCKQLWIVINIVTNIFWYNELNDSWICGHFWNGNPIVLKLINEGSIMFAKYFQIWFKRFLISINEPLMSQESTSLSLNRRSNIKWQS